MGPFPLMWKQLLCEICKTGALSLQDLKITEEKFSITGKCRTRKMTDLEHDVCLESTGLEFCFKVAS